MWDAPAVTAPGWPVPSHPAPGPVAPRGPLPITARALGVVAVALALAAVHLPHRPRTLCLFRTTTGLPCPLCGGTTAVAHLGRGDLTGALAASPLVTAAAFVVPFVGTLRLPAWATRPAVRLGLLGSVLLAAEIWQLVRFGVIGA
jgi:hypothetical protein